MKKLSILLLSLAAMGAFAFVLPSLPTGQSGAYPTETAFMAEAEEMFQKGNKLYEQGYMLQANYYYGQAVVAVASLRYGLSELIYVKQRDERAAAKKAAEEKQRKEDEEDMEDWGWEDEGGLLTALTNLTGKLDTMTEKLSQELVNMELDEDSERSEAWDLLATQSIASPYPYFFEAISWDYKGRKIRRENATPTRCATPLSRPPYGISPIGRTLRAASSGPLPAGCSPRRRNTASIFT